MGYPLDPYQNVPIQVTTRYGVWSFCGDGGDASPVAKAVSEGVVGVWHFGFAGERFVSKQWSRNSCPDATTEAYYGATDAGFNKVLVNGKCYGVVERLPCKIAFIRCWTGFFRQQEQMRTTYTHR